MTFSYWALLPKADCTTQYVLYIELFGTSLASSVDPMIGMYLIVS